MSTAPTTRGCRSVLRSVLAIALALWTSVGVAAAAPHTLGFDVSSPVIDGNGDDLINFATQIGLAGCVVDVEDPRDDLGYEGSGPGGSSVTPCSPIEDTDGNGLPDYWVNGHDIRRFVAVLDGTNLYLLFRAEGFIGDLDGNGDPDNNICDPPAQGILDAFGIGSADLYQAQIDTNCDDQPDILVNIANNSVNLLGATAGPTQFAFRQGGAGNASGHDLEVLITGITLPNILRIGGTSTSNADVLSEDVFAYQQCGGDAIPSLRVTTEASVASISPGRTVDFTTTVTNNGTLPLTEVIVVNTLDAGLVYDQTASSTCGGGIEVNGNEITYGPFDLAVGASCSIVLRAGRTPECQGQQRNNARVLGVFDAPCFGDENSGYVSNEATASVLCGDDETECKRPQIDVEKMAEAQIGDGGTIHYEIKATNPSSEVALENVVVTDQLCNFVRYKGNASPAPFSQPAVDAQGGTIVWKIPSLAKGQTIVLRFEAQAWLAGANITCPSEIECTNHVEAVGYCAGAGNVGPVEDHDTAETVISCRIGNCPRTVGFWTQQCAQKKGGSTKFTRAQMDQITGCVEATSSFFNGTNDFDSFCRIINPSSPMDQRKQAKRQFAALLANYCTHQLNLTPNNGAQLLLDPNTAVNCDGFAARTIGQLIIEIDGLLASLEGEDLSSGSVKTKYTNIISCTDAINNGGSIPTTPTCEHGGTESGSATGGLAEAGSIDVYGIELYRPFPNPFTTTTQFGFEVMQDEGANVDVAIYDVAGRKVRQLVTGTQSAGRQMTSWDGRNDAGATLPRGVYFVRTAIAGEKAPIQQILFVR